MSETKTIQLKKETLEYGQKRLETSPFQEYLKKNNLPDNVSVKTQNQVSR